MSFCNCAVFPNVDSAFGLMLVNSGRSKHSNWHRNLHIFWWKLVCSTQHFSQTDFKTESGGYRAPETSPKRHCLCLSF